MSDPHSLLGQGPCQSARRDFPKDFVCLAAAVLRRGRFGLATAQMETADVDASPRTRRLFHPSNHVMATKSSTPGWAWVWIERLWQDIRYGCRLLGANPGFTLVAVISLAMGVGANAAAFSWADALLLRPLAVARPGDIVTVGSTMSVEGFSRLGASYREYVDIRDRSSSFDGLVAFTDVTSGLASKR